MTSMRPLGFRLKVGDDRQEKTTNTDPSHYKMEAMAWEVNILGTRLNNRRP